MRDVELRLLRRALEAIRAVQQDIHKMYQQSRSNIADEPPPVRVDIDSEVRLPAAIHEYYRSANSEGPNDRRRDRVRLVIEIAALASAILAGIFTYRTLRQIKRQADSASSQVAIMQRQLRMDQRAWIVVKYGTIPLADGMPVVAPLIMENIGKTIAKNISGKASVYVLKKGQAPDLSYEPGHTHYDFGPTGTFIPNTPDTMNWSALREGKAVILTPAMHKAILEGSSLVAEHGRIEYYDIFGDYHWLTFCQETGGGTPRASGSDKCAAYNGTDDNDKAH